MGSKNNKQKNGQAFLKNGGFYIMPPVFAAQAVYLGICLDVVCQAVKVLASNIFDWDD